MVEKPPQQVQANRGRDILHCYHAALESQQSARYAAVVGDEELRQLYLEQARWRVALAMRFSGFACRID